MGNNRIQHYNTCTDRRRRRLGEPSTKQRGKYRELDEDCRKKLIYKMTQEREEDSKYIKTGSVITYQNGKLVTDRKCVLKVWEEYFKELLDQRETTN